MIANNPQDVLDFWFKEIPASNWWQKDDEFDRLIQQRFGRLHQQACANELFSWRRCANGALAEIIVLDQFSRNIYRDQAQAFSADPLALALAQVAVEQKLQQQLEPEQASFLLMPYMHSESLVIHQQAVVLFEQLGNSGNLEFEIKHLRIIEQFGRYPHRNAILKRCSTAAELAFLQQPGTSF